MENKEKGTKYTATAGFELISGTPTNDQQKNKSFSPLYGTNHAFNGFMDLFYVGNHFNSVGLRDIYLRTRYNFNSSFWIQGDYHNFAANATLLRDEYSGPELDKGFGSEIDLSLGKVISESVSIQAGYSQFLPLILLNKFNPMVNLRKVKIGPILCLFSDQIIKQNL